MSARTAFIKWSILGLLLAVISMAPQTLTIGSAAGLLRVGEDSGLRPLIEEQLGTVPLAPAGGHDGQLYYAIALDFHGDTVGPLLDHASFRYRRILFPLVGSGFGTLDGHALLAGMLIVNVLAAGIAAGAVAAVAVARGGSQWVALSVVLNPGLWLSLRLVTPDALALALMSLGLLLTTLKKERSTAGVLALSVLAKEAYLVTPMGLAMGRGRRAWLPLAASGAALGLWILWLTARFGSALSVRQNITIPFLGIWDASTYWPNLTSDEWFYLTVALASVFAGLVVGIWKPSFVRWPLLGWSILGVISSDLVWNLGNNAARVLAPIPLLVALSLSTSTNRSDSDFTQSPKPDD
jgi:hypothetical protein